MDKKNQTTFKKLAKPDSKDLLVVEVGDAKQQDFYPQVKFGRWGDTENDNECNVSIRLKDDTPGKGRFEEKDGKVIWHKGKKHASFYELQNEEYPEGAFEFDITLDEKPNTNVIEFTLQDKDVEYFYQPALTQEEIDRGAKRPEDVIGSYAVYAKTPKTNWKGGKEYKVGKVGHIYRPKIYDAQGKEVWGELKIDKGLTVTIPQEFLDSAVYPIIVDPTFGYESKGGSTMTVENVLRAIVDSPSGSGTTSKISAYVDFYGTGFNREIGYGLYTDNNLEGYESILRPNDTDGLFEINISLEITTDVNRIAANTSTFNSADIYYDSGSEGDGALNTGATFFPDPADFSLSTLKPSIYATYTADSGETYNFYNSFKADQLDGTIDLDTDTIKVALVTSSYTFDQDAHHFFSDITNEVTGTGYTAGGETLANTAITTDDTSDLGKYDADNVTWTGATITFRGAVIYKSTGVAGTSPLIAFIDFGSDQVASGEDVEIDWDTTGVFQLA